LCIFVQKLAEFLCKFSSRASLVESFLLFYFILFYCKWANRLRTADMSVLATVPNCSTYNTVLNIILMVLSSKQSSQISSVGDKGAGHKTLFTQA